MKHIASALFAHSVWCWHWRIQSHLLHTHAREHTLPVWNSCSVSACEWNINLSAFSSLITIATASAWSWFRRLLRSLSAKWFSTLLPPQGHHWHTEQTAPTVLWWMNNRCYRYQETSFGKTPRTWWKDICGDENTFMVNWKCRQEVNETQIRLQ